MRLFRVACVATVALSATTAGAAAWKFEAGNGTCSMKQQVKGGWGKPFIDVELTWHGVMGHGAHVFVPQLFVRDSFVRLQSLSSPQSWSRPTDGSGPIATGGAADLLRKNLQRGLPIVVTIEGGASKPLRYATRLEGAKEAVTAFETCIRDERQRVATEDRAFRWRANVDVRGRCSLWQPQAGVAGLSVRVDLGPDGEPQLWAGSDERYFPKGGQMRIHLPGQPLPLQLDSHYVGGTPVGATAFLGELRKGNVARTVFEPREAAAVELSLPREGLVESIAMFDACRAVRTRPRPEVIPLNELQYSVDESAAGCRLSAAYQLESAVIWLVAAADADGNHVTLTKRVQRHGEQFAYLDITSLGGPALLEADDAVFPVDNPAFKSLVLTAMGEGHEIRFLVTQDRGYSLRFGGPQAISETAMFDACMRAKYPARS